MNTQPPQLAAWWRRGLNFILDTTVILLLWQWVANLLMTQFAYSRDGFWVIALFVTIPLVYFLYYFLTEYFFGKTFGKLITRTWTLGVTGENPTASQLLARSFARMIPIDAFTFFSVHPTGWHDVFASTRVVQRPTSEAVVSRTKPTGAQRFWRRLWITLTVVLLLSWVSVPTFTVMRWQYPKVADSSSEAWERVDITPQFSLKLPYSKVRQLAPGLWSARLVGLQTIEIERYETVAEVEDRLAFEFQQLRQAPFTIVQLSEYEANADGGGRYRYQLDQVPFVGGGFWVTADEEAVYMVRFMGFGVDVDSALDAIEENLALPQHSTQL